MKNAVQSVLNQQIEKTRVQIIVVKNFSDKSIDLFLEENGVMNIYTTEKSFGMKLSIGIDNATGGIITFLDDDDMFALNKLEKVKGIFLSDPETVYVHNSITKIGENENPLNKAKTLDRLPFIIDSGSADWESWGRSMTLRGDWYVSCITLEKSFAVSIINVLKVSARSLDKVIYLCAAASGKKMVFTIDKFTFYRKHESVTGVVGSPEEFRMARFKFTSESIGTLDNVAHMLGIVSEFIPYHIIMVKLKANRLLYEQHHRKASLALRRELKEMGRRSNSKESKMLAALLLMRFFSINLAYKLFRYYQMRDPLL